MRLTTRENENMIECGLVEICGFVNEHSMVELGEEYQETLIVLPDGQFMINSTLDSSDVTVEQASEYANSMSVTKGKMKRFGLTHED